MEMLQDYNLMYRSPRRVLFVHNKSATGRSRDDGGGLGSWTGARLRGTPRGGEATLNLESKAPGDWARLCAKIGESYLA